MNNTINTKCLFVCFDAGETTGLIPVMQRMEKKGYDFRVLVMATAATVLTPDMFKGKRLELSDLGFSEVVDRETTRKTRLAGLERIKQQINPKVVVVGNASQGIQKQILKLYTDRPRISYSENFYYDLDSYAGKVVKKVASSANYIFCPSSNLVEIFKERLKPLPKKSYKIVGKPSLDAWAKEIAKVEKEGVYRALNLQEAKGPVVVLIGGYGDGYDVVNPMYEKCKEKLENAGYQVVYQPHPKISKPLVPTTSVLAIADYVVGFNSSVLFDSLLIGKKAVYLIPSGTSYNHFAIDKGFAPKVENEEQLMEKMEELRGSAKRDIAEELQIPSKSAKLIFNNIKELSAPSVTERIINFFTCNRCCFIPNEYEKKL